MVKEAETAEKLAQSKLHSRNETLGKQDFEKELSKIASSNDTLQRKVSSLRQVSSAAILSSKFAPKFQARGLKSRNLAGYVSRLVSVPLLKN